MKASSASPLKRCGLVVYLNGEQMKLNLIPIRVVKSMATMSKAVDKKYVNCSS
jgi:hypothetical protein